MAGMGTSLVARYPAAVPQPKPGNPHLVQLTPGDGQVPTWTGHLHRVSGALDVPEVIGELGDEVQVAHLTGGLLSEAIGEGKC